MLTPTFVRPSPASERYLTIDNAPLKNNEPENADQQGQSTLDESHYSFKTAISGELLPELSRDDDIESEQLRGNIDLVGGGGYIGGLIDIDLSAGDAGQPINKPAPSSQKFTSSRVDAEATQHLLDSSRSTFRKVYEFFYCLFKGCEKSSMQTTRALLEASQLTDRAERCRRFIAIYGEICKKLSPNYPAQILVTEGAPNKFRMTFQFGDLKLFSTALPSDIALECPPLLNIALEINLRNIIKADRSQQASMAQVDAPYHAEDILIEDEDATSTQPLESHLQSAMAEHSASNKPGWFGHLFGQINTACNLPFKLEQRFADDEAVNPDLYLVKTNDAEGKKITIKGENDIESRLLVRTLYHARKQADGSTHFAALTDMQARAAQIKDKLVESMPINAVRLALELPMVQEEAEQTQFPANFTFA